MELDMETPISTKKIRFLYENAPITGQGRLTRRESKRVQIVMTSALWKKDPNPYTYMKGFNLIKLYGIGYGKPHVQKRFKFLYGNAPITNYCHVPLLLNTNMVLALNVSNI